MPSAEEDHDHDLPCYTRRRSHHHHRWILWAVNAALRYALKSFLLIVRFTTRETHAPSFAHTRFCRFLIADKPKPVVVVVVVVVVVLMVMFVTDREKRRQPSSSDKSARDNNIGTKLNQVEEASSDDAAAATAAAADADARRPMGSRHRRRQPTRRVVDRPFVRACRSSSYGSSSLDFAFCYAYAFTCTRSTCRLSRGRRKEERE